MSKLWKKGRSLRPEKIKLRKSLDSNTDEDIKVL